MHYKGGEMQNKRILSVFLLILSLILTSPNLSEAVQYTLTVTSISDRVTSSPAGIDCPAVACTASFDSGTVVTLTATPDLNQAFSGWTNGTGSSSVCSGTGTCNFVLLSASTVTANFQLKTYTVTPSAGAGGTISPSIPQTVGPSSILTFTVTPDANYSASVGGTCGGTLLGTTYTTNAITANCTVTANFTEACTYSLSQTSQSFDQPGGSGKVYVTATSGCAWTAASNASWADITSGSSGKGDGTVSFAVAANSGTGRTGSLTIANHTFTITQSAVRYTLVLTKSGTGHGAIYKSGLFSGLFAANLLCGTDCSVAILEYDTGTLTLYAVPEAGTTFIGWSGGVCSGTGTCTVTLNEDISVNAAFSSISAPVTDSATTKLEITGSDIYLRTPIIKYINNADSTTTYYSAEFVYMPTNDNKTWLKLTRADVLADISLYSGSQLSQLYQVNSDLRLHLTTIEYNGVSVWADLEYIPANDGILWFVITGSGTN